MKPTLSARKKRLASLTALLLWLGCLLWLSLTPSPPRPPTDLLSWDKLHHAGAYALLTALTGLCFLQWRTMRHPWLYAWLVATILGGVVELLQGTMTDARQAEWSDVLANALGGLLTVTAAFIRQRCLQHKSSSP